MQRLVAVLAVFLTVGCTSSTTVPANIHPGITYKRHELPGPVIAHVVTVDLTNKSIVPLVVPAKNMHQGGRETTSAMAKKVEALVAINADYFGGSGPAQGFVVIDSEMVVGPAKRTAFGWTKDGKPVIDRYVLEGHGYVEAQDGSRYSIFYNRVNIHDFGPGEMAIFTPHWGRQPPKSSNASRVWTAFCRNVSKQWKGSVLNGTVEAVVKDALANKGEFIVAASDNGKKPCQWLLDHVKVGEKISVHLKTKPMWDHLQYAIGGGPRLLRDGVNLVDSANINKTMAEEIGIQLDRRTRPRTALGYDKDRKKLFLVVVENPGMTPSELAEFMKKQGAYQAMMFDGGGSSTMVIKGQVVNAIGTLLGHERPVANCLTIVETKK